MLVIGSEILKKTPEKNVWQGKSEDVFSVGQELPSRLNSEFSRKALTSPHQQGRSSQRSQIRLITIVETPTNRPNWSSLITRQGSSGEIET